MAYDRTQGQDDDPLRWFEVALPLAALLATLVMWGCWK